MERATTLKVLCAWEREYYRNPALLGPANELLQVHHHRCCLPSVS